MAVATRVATATVAGRQGDYRHGHGGGYGRAYVHGYAGHGYTDEGH